MRPIFDWIYKAAVSFVTALCALVLLLPVLAEEPPLQRTLQLRGQPRLLAFSLNGNLLAVGTAGLVEFWDPGTGVRQGDFRNGTSLASSIAISSDFKMIATGGGDGIIRSHSQVQRGLQGEFKGHTDKVTALAFSPDGNTLASASPDHTIRLWDVMTGRNTATLQGDAAGYQPLVFSPDSKTLAWSATDDTARLVDVATGKEKTVLRGDTLLVQSLAYSPNGGMLLAGGSDRHGQRIITVWDMRTAEKRTVLRETSGRASRFLVFSPDGKILASARESSPIRIWDVEKGEERVAFQGHQQTVASLAFSPDGKILATGSFDRTVKLWDVSALKPAVK